MGYRSKLSWVGVVAVSMGLAGCKTPTAGPTVAQQYHPSTTTTVTQAPMSGGSMPGSTMQSSPSMANSGMTPASQQPQAWGPPPNRQTATPPVTSAPTTSSSYSTAGMTSPSITNSPSARSTQGYPTPTAPSLGGSMPTMGGATPSSMAGTTPMPGTSVSTSSPIRQVSTDSAPMMPPVMNMTSGSPLGGAPQVDPPSAPKPMAPPARMSMDNSQANPLTLPPPAGSSVSMPRVEVPIHEVPSTPSRSPMTPTVETTDNGPSLGGDH